MPERVRLSAWIGAATIALIVAVCPAARGQNPRITLRLDNVSPEQAVAALAKTSGIPVQLQIDPRQTDWLPQSRVSFNWRSVTFAEALRQIADRFRLEPTQRAPNNYLLTGPDAWGRQLSPEPVDDAALVEQQGVRLMINQLRGRQGGLTMDLACEIPEGDTARIAGVENLVLVDDQGNVAAPISDRITGSRFNPRTPDVWIGSCGMFANSDPNASKLALVEGDLMVYRKMRPVRMEVGLPGVRGEGRGTRGEGRAGPQAGKPEPSLVRQEPHPPSGAGESGVRVEILKFEPGPAPLAIARARTTGKVDPKARLAGSLIPHRGPNELGPALLVRIVLPPDAPCAVADPKKVDWGGVRHPILVGASGRPYGPFALGTNARREGENTIIELTCGWSDIREPVESAVFELVERAEPQRLFTFQMLDIPMPRRWGRGGGMNAPFVKPVHHALYQAKGATLESSVRLGERAAPGGTLQLGMALRGAEGWGPTRWFQLTVDTSGRSRLPDLKPGSYRVLRRYDGKAGPTTGGAWQNTETVLEIARGKVVSLPPLRWEAR